MSCGDGIIKASFARSKPPVPADTDPLVLLLAEDPEDEDELPDV